MILIAVFHAMASIRSDLPLLDSAIFSSLSCSNRTSTQAQFSSTVSLS